MMNIPENHVADSSLQPPRSPSPEKRRRGCLPVLLAIFMVCLILITTLIGIGILGMLAAVGDQLETEPSGEKFKETFLRHDADIKDKVAVINIKGLIAFDMAYEGCDAEVVSMQLDQAGADPHVVAVVLDMNTPGGEITAADEIHQAVQRLRETGKPVVTCMRSLGASGGYYIAAASDYILANRLTITGSIGVMFPQVRYQKLLDKLGVAYTPYTSGSMKTLLSGAIERDEHEQRQVDRYMQSMIDESFQQFARVVAAGREMYESAQAVDQAPFADGRILSGDQAVDFGLVDEIGYFRNAVSKAASLAETRRYNVVRYRRSMSLMRMFLAKAGRTPEVRIDTGLNFRGLRGGGRLYYLLPTFVE